MSPELQQRMLADQIAKDARKHVPHVPQKKHGLRTKVEELLAVGVSRQWIAHYLDCPIKTVNRISNKWKRDKLPAILQKRANLEDCSA
jgi:CRP-like cAMP-binding protein